MIVTAGRNGSLCKLGTHEWLIGIILWTTYLYNLRHLSLPSWTYSVFDIVWMVVLQMMCALSCSNFITDWSEFILPDYMRGFDPLVFTSDWQCCVCLSVCLHVCVCLSVCESAWSAGPFPRHHVYSKHFRQFSLTSYWISVSVVSGYHHYCTVSDVLTHCQKTLYFVTGRNFVESKLMFKNSFRKRYEIFNKIHGIFLSHFQHWDVFESPYCVYFRYVLIFLCSCLAHEMWNAKNNH